MRKVKLGLIFAAVAMLAVGCSNLWDYVPPVRKPSKTTPPPSKTEPPVDETPPSADGPSSSGPSSPSGPSYTPPASPPKVLTFYVDDGSGTLKEVKIQTDNKTATAAQIIAAYKGNPTAPNGFAFETDGSGFKWYKSDTVTPIGAGSYSSGEKFVLGLTPATGDATNGYTIMTAPTSSRDTGRDFVTTPTSEGSKMLKDVLVAAGIADSSDVDAKPKTTPSGWDFIQWAKPGLPNPSDLSNKVNPSTPFYSGDKIVAVYNVTYIIKINDTDYPITVPVAAPNDGATWADILAAAKNGTITAAAGGVAQLDKMLWKVGSSVADDNKRYPANTTFIGTAKGPETTTPISYTIKDAVGKEITVKVDVPQSQASTGATLQDIIDEAKKQPGTNFGNADITIDSWTKDGGANTVSTSEKIAPSATIQPKERTAKYYVTKQKATESNPHPTPETVELKLAVDATGNTWNDILNKTTGGASGGFDSGRVNNKWTYEGLDGVSKLDPVNAQAYAPGTRFSAVYLTMKLPNRDDWSEAADKFDAHKLPTTQWALQTANGEYVYVIFADEYDEESPLLAKNSFITLYYGLSSTSMEEAVKKALIAKAYVWDVASFGDPNMQTGFAAFKGSTYGDLKGLDDSTALIMTPADFYVLDDEAPKSPIYGLYKINSDGDLIKSGDATNKSDGNMMALQNIYFKVGDGVIDTDDIDPDNPPSITEDNVVPFDRPPYWRLRYDLEHIVIVDSSGKYISAEAQTVTCDSAKECSSPNFATKGAVTAFPTIDGVPADVGTGAVSVGTGASTDNYTAADFKGWVNIDDLPNEGETVPLITTQWNKNAHATLVAVFQKP